jgi:phage gp36-like protein
MANVAEATLAEAGERTASGVGETIDIGALREAAKLSIRVVTAVGDRAKLALKVESSDDETNWRPAWASPGNIAGVEVHVGELSRYVRASWTFGSGITSAVFTIGAEFHQLFATKADLFSGDIPREALEAAKVNDIYKALISASQDAEDALAASNALPLTKWPSSLTQRVTGIATYLVMKVRGFQPQGSDELIVKAHDDAQKWLKDVAAGRIRPPGLAPATRLGPQTSSGNPRAPEKFTKRMSDDWGSF